MKSGHVVLNKEQRAEYFEMRGLHMRMIYQQQRFEQSDWHGILFDSLANLAGRNKKNIAITIAIDRAHVALPPQEFESLRRILGFNISLVQRTKTTNDVAFFIHSISKSQCCLSELILPGRSEEQA